MTARHVKLLRLHKIRSGAVKGLRVGTPVEAHTQKAEVVTIDEDILDSTDPGIPASQKVAKTKRILAASDTCAPETTPSST